MDTTVTSYEGRPALRAALVMMVIAGMVISALGTAFLLYHYGENNMYPWWVIPLNFVVGVGLTSTADQKYGHWFREVVRDRTVVERVYNGNYGARYYLVVKGLTRAGNTSQVTYSVDPFEYQAYRVGDVYPAKKADA